MYYLQEVSWTVELWGWSFGIQARVCWDPDDGDEKYYLIGSFLACVHCIDAARHNHNLPRNSD